MIKEKVRRRKFSCDSKPLITHESFKIQPS